MNAHYDAVVVGAGPAGLFGAFTLLERRSHARLVLLEAGPDLDSRLAATAGSPVMGALAGAANTSSLTGFGGAGLFIGGRLSYDLSSPSAVPLNLSRQDAQPLIGELDALLARWNALAPMQDVPPTPLAAAAARAAGAGFIWRLPYPARHLGPDSRLSVMRALRDDIESAGSVIRTGVSATWLDPSANGWLIHSGDRTAEEIMQTDAVLLAPGRGGSEWLAGVLEHLGVPVQAAPSVGVRIEVGRDTLAPLTDLSPDPRLFMADESGEFRTYAFCRGGSIRVIESTRGPRVTCRPGNGTSTTSVAILWRPGDASPPVALQPNPRRARARVQRLGDLRAGLPTSPAALAANSVQPTLNLPPGDVLTCWPPAYWAGFCTFLDRLNALAPGVTDGGTLVYAPAIEPAWSFPVAVDGSLPRPGLFAAGDGAGLSQGALAAAISGIAAGAGMARLLDPGRAC